VERWGEKSFSCLKLRTSRIRYASEGLFGTYPPPLAGPFTFAALASDVDVLVYIDSACANSSKDAVGFAS